MTNNDTNDGRTIDRFDIPQSVRNLLAEAIDSQLADGFDLYALATKHGDNWRGLAHDLVEWAFAGVHSPQGTRVHERIAVATDAVFVQFPRPKGV